MGGPFLLALLLTCALIAIGFALRVSVGWLRALYIPASAVGGVVGFAVIQGALRIPQVAGRMGAVADEMASWPAWLIVVVFAGLLLERSSGKSFGEAIRRGARSAVLAWIIVLGQIAIGLVVYITFVRSTAPTVPACFAQLLEVSWAGGHGSSAAMGQVYSAMGFPQGRDLAFFLATIGLVWGVISGLVLVNIAIRRRWTAQPAALSQGRATMDDSPDVPIAYAKTRPEVLEPLALQVVILAAAFAVGCGLRETFIAASSWIANHASDRSDQAIGPLASIPLFLFTLLGGLIVRNAMRILRIDTLIDSLSIQRLVGVSMDILVVAAIATMRVDTLRTFFFPIVAMIVLASVWSAFCLLYLARKLLPAAYWFELGLLNYGFSTANTPQGMMLLRIVDADLATGAAEDYAVAAPLSAPFIGGGVLTIAVIPLILARIPAALALVFVIAAMVLLYFAGRRFSR